MKMIFLIVFLNFLHTFCFSQETYSATKGPRFMPGHLHAVITIENKILHYHLFNHWYASSYRQYRDLKIPIEELAHFNETNDTLTITISQGKIKLIDRSYQFKKTIKQQKNCTSLATMRKIAYACQLADQNEQVRHFDLYDRQDLNLSESAFKILVNKNLKKKLKQTAVVP